MATLDTRGSSALRVSTAAASPLRCWRHTPQDGLPASQAPSHDRWEQGRRQRQRGHRAGGGHRRAAAGRRRPDQRPEPSSRWEYQLRGARGMRCSRDAGRASSSCVEGRRVVSHASAKKTQNPGGLTTPQFKQTSYLSKTVRQSQAQAPPCARVSAK